MIPLGDVSRRPIHFPIVTLLIIVVNALVFVLELVGGEAFIRQWSLVPADVVAGRHPITALTAMFMHGGWSHILGNMVFLWAFGPEIEDAMNPGRYLAFYLAGGVAAMLAQVAVSPGSTVPTLGASGAIAAVMGAFLITYPRDRIRTVLFIGFLCHRHLRPGVLVDRIVVSHPTRERRRRDKHVHGRGGLHGPRGRRRVRGDHRAVLRGPAPAR